MAEKTPKLGDGAWVYWSIDGGMPSELTLFTGSWESRRKVGTLTKMQVLGYCRWHPDESYGYYSVKDGNDRWKDIRVRGDIDTFFRGNEGV